MFKSAARQKDQLLREHGKVKKGFFDLQGIAQYWKKGTKDDNVMPLTDRTYADLDMDEVFMFADRTTSRVGQQFLYAQLRSIAKDGQRAEQQEQLIGQFQANARLREDCIWQLSQLSKPEAYHLCTLFLDQYLQKPKWFWLVQLMAGISLATVVTVLFIPNIWFILFLVLAVNFGIHYWNKQNLYEYGVSIPQLLRMVQVASRLRKLTQTDKEALNQAIRQIDALGNSLWVFKLEKGLQSDVGQVAEFFVELLRAFFLIEPILLFRSLKKLEEQKENIHSIYRFVGETDLAISVQALREDSATYCRPEFMQNREILAKGIYHPLLAEPVTNDLVVNDRSVLLTGSNMSGKTTFIRTIGINAILGQTINTCFASEFRIPRLYVHSAIRMADDLMSDKSFFLEEVLTIKGMLEQSNSEMMNLFLLDELFKGTNTLERIAGGKAILSHLNAENNIVFIASHDLELAAYLENEYDLYHFSEVIKDQEIIFDYLIKPGNLTNTNALKILEINGFPSSIIREANELVNQIKGN